VLQPQLDLSFPLNLTIPHLQQLWGGRMAEKVPVVGCCLPRRSHPRDGAPLQGRHPHNLTTTVHTCALCQQVVWQVWLQDGVHIHMTAHYCTPAIIRRDGLHTESRRDKPNQTLAQRKAIRASARTRLRVCSRWRIR
jgi:hypothetical protein